MITPSRVKVTVLRCFNMNEVFKDPPIKIRYNGQCDAFKEGQEFILGAEKIPSMPDGFCSFAWDTLFPWIMITRSGGD